MRNRSVGTLFIEQHSAHYITPKQKETPAPQPGKPWFNQPGPGPLIIYSRRCRWWRTDRFGSRRRRRSRTKKEEEEDEEPKKKRHHREKARRQASQESERTGGRPGTTTGTAKVERRNQKTRRREGREVRGALGKSSGVSLSSFNRDRDKKKSSEFL